jgi:hypothetical protein
MMFLFVGALCGALLMFGLTTLRQPSSAGTAPVVYVTPSGEMSAPLAGHLGGVTSSDPANDFLVRQALTDEMTALIGGRLGGIESSDTAVDASTKAALNRVVGPGEGLNQFVDNSVYQGSENQRIMGPGEGLNQVQ